jgi:hypothetical protein
MFGSLELKRNWLRNKIIGSVKERKFLAEKKNLAYNHLKLFIK